jgi:hypothetical protein
MAEQWQTALRIIAGGRCLGTLALVLGLAVLRQAGLNHHSS